VRNLAENIFSRAGVLAFAKAIGFGDEPYRLKVDCADVEHLGRRGSLRCVLVITGDHAPDDLNRLACHVRTQCAGELQLFLFATAHYERVCVATFRVDQLATLTLVRGRIHAADVDALVELIPRNGEAGLQLALRHARALDRLRVSKRFFDDFRGQRATISKAWTGIAPRLQEERDQLALLLLSRLMFLYFLQRRGFLCSDAEFFLGRLRDHFAAPRRCSFYRAVLRPLFFGVLNRRPERRTGRAAALGPLPYLNGGLFERHQLERRFPLLDLGDDVARGIFEFLLERYRFTATEGDADLAIDPEMLGRVFEGLMADAARQSTGTFYTPAPVVDRMVRSAFDAYLEQYPNHQRTQLLRDVRVLDPACGSGAFLLRALAHISERCAGVAANSAPLRRAVVARNLHGVDLQQDAALLCALRLWLCLIPDAGNMDVPPLPNLDRRIRQGDALIDPFDLAAESAANAAVRAARRALQPLVLRYTTCDPEERQGVQRLVSRHERQLSHAWLKALSERLRYQIQETRAQAAARDLFGEAPVSALHARQQLCDLETRALDLKRLALKLKDNGALPFFSFNVHFADAERAGFEIILCNPPWVRSHHWPKHLATTIKRRFRVCRAAGQVDLALVFLERAVSLLTDHGVLAIILPAKFLRSASAGAARELLLQQMDVLSIEDHSLDQRSIFGADSFAAVLIARKKTSSPNRTSVSMIRRNVSPLTFSLHADQLPFDARDARSAWLLVPDSVRATLLRMSERGKTIASQFCIRRGVVTGANAALIVTEARLKLGGLAVIRSEGGAEAIIESEILHPLVRGADIDSWQADLKHRIVFCHDSVTAAHRAPPKRAARYLGEHILPDASGRLGALQHVSRADDLHMLAWHDLASTLKAVVIPPTMSCLSSERRVIALNTVYYISASEADALLLAAYFNSLPLRVFARAIAERAKDAHFRFFACTVGMLPLPTEWRCAKAEFLRELSKRAHAEMGLTADSQHELDEVVSAAFGLSAASIQALRRFDVWLAGAA
jgi:type I restriction-modification system DNA methylase subunit